MFLLMGGLEMPRRQLDIFWHLQRFVLPSFIYIVERPKGHNYSSVFVNATNTVCHLSSSADDAVISAPAPGKATRLYGMKSCLNRAGMNSNSGCSRQIVNFPTFWTHI